MEQQNNSKHGSENESSFLEDVLDAAAYIEDSITDAAQKYAMMHDILLVMSNAAQVIKHGVEAVMELSMDDNEETEGGKEACQKCPNCPRN